MKDGVYKLRQDSFVESVGSTLQAGREIEIVNNVVYMEGYPVDRRFQPLMLEWMEKNPNLFLNDTRDW